MAWVYLFIAGLMEILWAISLKYSHSFTRLVPGMIALAGMVFSVIFLMLALKAIPVGTAYAVWTGIGAVGTAVLGIILFGESGNLVRILCILLIVAGIAGLKLSE